MLPWLRTPWKAQAGFGQGGRRLRRFVFGLGDDFEFGRIAIKSC